MAHITAKNIVIVGGQGQMGQLFMRLLQAQGHAVAALGEADWFRAKEMLSPADMVMIAVPIAETEGMIRKVAPYLKSDCLLTDITSTKHKPLQAMCAAHPGPVLGLHPVFGPTIGQPHQHVIVYCEGREPKAFEWLVRDLVKLNFVLHPMMASAHDRAMDLIQGMQLFLIYCMGVFLQEQSVDLQELLAISTPLNRLQVNMVGRIFYQNAELYADILMSDQKRAETLTHFVKLNERLLKQVQDKDRGAFIKEFESVKKWLGPFAKQAQDKTDEILNQ